MPWTGSAPSQSYLRSDGVRTGAAVNVTARNAGVNDTAELADYREQDMATALSLALKRDGGNTVTGDLPMGNHKLTGMAMGTARDDSIRLDQVQDGDLIYATVGGTANAITLTLTPAVSALVAGMQVIFFPTNDNSSSVTINTNSIGAIALELNNAALTGGELQAGQPAIIVHDGSVWNLANPYAVLSPALQAYPDPTSNDADALGTGTASWSDLFLASGGVINWNNGDVTVTHSANALAFAGASSGYTFDASLSIGTANALTAGTIELGAASDTTLSRSAAGILAVEGVDQVNLSASQTLTNKTLTSPVINTGTIGTSLAPTSNDGAALGSTSNQFSDLFLAEGGVINWDNGDVSITQTGNVLAFAGASSGYTWDAGLVVGHTAQLATGGVTANFAQFGTTAATGTAVIGMFNTSAATQGELQFYRSKNAAIGSATVVANNDGLGKITWYGAQQTGTFATQNPAAQIRAEVDNAVTSGSGGDMPGRIVFSTTANASGSLTDRMMLTSAGLLSPTSPGGIDIGDITNYVNNIVCLNANITAITTGSITCSGTLSAGAVVSSGSLGFTIGSGSSVTQATNKTTGVTLNNRSGRITMAAGSLSAGASATFTVSNSLVINNASVASVILVTHVTGGTANAYRVHGQNIVDGTSFSITVTNITAGSLNETPVLHFMLLNSPYV